jgi:DNA polymerase III alpha subunit
MKLDNAVPTKEELEQLSKKEQEYTGILLKKVPLIKLKEKYSSQFTNLVSLRSFLDSSVENGYYHIIVKINSITTFKDKNGHPMSFISVEDETLFMNKLPIF